MAYSFNGTNQQITSSPAAVINGASVATLAFWVNRSSATKQTAGFSATNGTRFQITPFTDNNIYINAENGVNREASVALATTSGAMHMCMVFDGSAGTNATKLKLFQSGVQSTLIFTGAPPSTLTSSLGTFRIGRYESGNHWTTGELCEVAIWATNLTNAEVLSLSKGFSPRRVRPQSLRFYTPLVRDLNEIENAYAQTNSNGATVVPHVRRYG